MIRDEVTRIRYFFLRKNYYMYEYLLKLLWVRNICGLIIQVYIYILSNEKKFGRCKTDCKTLYIKH